MIALFLLAVAAADLVPMRWPAAEPKSLEALDGTPVNCILLESDAWAPGLIAEAKRKTISVLAVVHPSASAVDEMRRAAVMPFDGFVLEGDFPPAERERMRSLARDLIVELPSRQGMHLDSKDPVIGTSQGVWAGIEIEHGGKVMSAPTSSPWIFTNAGFLRFVRASTKSAIWMGVKPPPGNIYRPDRYVQAIADAEICGARWIIALEEGLQARLMRNEPNAVRDWKFIVRHLTYFQEHREAHEWRDWSEFGVLQDAVTGGLLSFGLLDMLASQRTAVRPIPVPRLGAEELRGARVVLNVDPADLKPEQAQVLEQFRKSGGDVLAPPEGWHYPAVAQGEFVMGRREVDAMQPLWEITYKATLRKNFGSRTFNTAGVLSNTVASPDGNTAIVFLINYTDFPVESITVHALGTWKKVRVFVPAGKVRDLEIYPVSGGTGVDLDSLATVAAVRFER
jgi:hypothetical protein